MSLFLPLAGKNICIMYYVICAIRSHLKNIIVVEQNPSESSETELNFIVDEEWPLLLSMFLPIKLELVMLETLYCLK
jgi:hypothetical protein